MTPLDEALAETSGAITRLAEQILPESQLPEAALIDGMRYALTGGGKRLRPFLVRATADLFAVDRRCSLRAGLAVECIHAYSLTHDDLPELDDAALRRGRPSVHRAFGHATALLVGDALQTLAFEILAHPDTHADPLVRADLVFGLARAAGHAGMVGGQVLDMLGERVALDAPQVTRLSRLKTGELIAFACEAGAILGRAGPPQRHALRAYAHDLGLAFQIVDDLLDDGDPGETGKAAGADWARRKSTFLTLLGAERARAQASLLTEQAEMHLDIFHGRAEILAQLARNLLTRRG